MDEDEKKNVDENEEGGGYEDEGNQENGGETFLSNHSYGCG